MKKYFKIVFVSALLAQSVNASAQGGNTPADTTRRYYSRLASSKEDADKALLESKLYSLLQSAKEEDWLTASNFFYQLKKVSTSDSIQAAVKIKFPQGIVVRNEQTKTVYDEKDPVKKEALYKAWIKCFPPAKFEKDRIQYDYVRNAVAVAYAEADNVKKALEYANLTETPVWKGEGWAGPAMTLIKKGHLEEAKALLKKARNNSYKYMTTHRNEPGASFAATGYVGYNSSLADILYRQKKYSGALTYIREAHDSSKTVRGYLNASYAKILIALGRDKEAFDIIDEAVKEGQATTDMKETLKTLYAKVKGSNSGYDEYMASVTKMLAEKIRKDLAKQMIKLPAPGFTLTDINGKEVSLEAMKGKVVLLDFWATWCGPCKASFPAMQMAVNRYKNDADVQFLFIHTWERGDSTPVVNAKKFIEEKKYSFLVPMDLKDPVTGVNKVVESYKVTGIPTKFVIDKNGNIRFKFTGFSGGEDAAVEEVAAMIELARAS
jgi:thiol-disulfide isomerase/thioredoxin